MAKYDLPIRGGTVIDGLRTPRYRGDVAVNGKIVVIDGDLRQDDAAEVIDAKGKIVAPGVVDLHTHYNSQIFWDPWCIMSGWQGMTSVMIGNCGFGFAPVARRGHGPRERPPGDLERAAGRRRPKPAW